MRERKKKDVEAWERFPRKANSVNDVRFRTVLKYKTQYLMRHHTTCHHNAPISHLPIYYPLTLLLLLRLSRRTPTRRRASRTPTLRSIELRLVRADIFLTLLAISFCLTIFLGLWSHTKQRGQISPCLGTMLLHFFGAVLRAQRIFPGMVSWFSGFESSLGKGSRIVLGFLVVHISVESSF